MALLDAADRAGFGRIHIVGYSAGGAVSLAFAAAHPRRLLSLALLEPTWSGNRGLGAEERALWREFDRIMALPPSERMAAFVRVQLAEGVAAPPPPPGPPPPWMVKRPVGLAALTTAFGEYDLDERRLRAFTQPVYYALAGRSKPNAYARQAERLAGLFPDFSPRAAEPSTTTATSTAASAATSSTEACPSRLLVAPPAARPPQRLIAPPGARPPQRLIAPPGARPRDRGAARRGRWPRGRDAAR